MTQLALLLAAMALVAVLSRRAQSGGSPSQRFWRDLATAAFFGFLATAIKALSPPDTHHVAWTLVATGVDALAYSFVAMAAGRQPYQVSPWQVPRLHAYWMRPGVLIAITGAWTYVMLVPLLGTADQATTLTQVRGLFVALGCYVTIRLALEAASAKQAGDRHWRRVFVWLTTASAAWLLSRLLRTVETTTTSTFPFLVAVLTVGAGAGLIMATLAPEPANSTSAPELWTSPRAIPMRSTLHTTIFALAFPIAHIVLHAAGAFPDALRVYRERVVLAALVLLGALALVQRTLLRRRSAALTAEHRRIEAMIRQHQTSLDLNEARRSASTSIRNAADRFERTFRACPSLMAIVDARDGEILEVNESFERIAGLPRQDALGQSASQFGLWPATDDAQPWTDALRKGATIRDQRLALRDRRGDRRTLRVSAATVDLEHRTAYLLLGRDVTDHEAMLRDTTRYARWLDQASAILMVVNADDRLATWSRGAEDFFGSPLDAVRDTDAAALLGGSTADDWSDFFAHARASGHGLARLEAATTSGEVRVACRFATVTDNRERSHILCALTPLSDTGALAS